MYPKWLFGEVCRVGNVQTHQLPITAVAALVALPWGLRAVPVPIGEASVTARTHRHPHSHKTHTRTYTHAHTHTHGPVMLVYTEQHTSSPEDMHASKQTRASSCAPIMRACVYAFMHVSIHACCLRNAKADKSEDVLHNVRDPSVVVRWPSALRGSPTHTHAPIRSAVD